MSQYPGRHPAVKSRSATLELNEERTVRVRAAIGLVLAAEHVAFNVRLNDVNGSIVDLPKSVVLRTLRRMRHRLGNAAQVKVSNLFGSVVVGL